MARNDLKKRIMQFSKEEIIEAIINKGGNYSIAILSSLEKNYDRQLELKIDATFKEWDKASKDLTAFLNKVNADYKGVTVLDLPANVRDEYLRLTKREDKLYNDLENLQNELEASYQNRLKTR